MLALARQIIPNEKVVKSPAGGSWNIVVGTAVYGKTLGIIGLGIIGKQLSVWAKGFGMNIIAYDPVPDVAYAANNNIKLVSLEELLKTSDFVSLHLPLMPSTKNLINKETLKMMKPTAYIINAARGGIINGIPDGEDFRFGPKEEATRAHAAAMIARFYGTLN